MLFPLPGPLEPWEVNICILGPGASLLRDGWVARSGQAQRYRFGPVLEEACKQM